MEKMIGNFCESEMNYVDMYGGTHIWVCNYCPIVMFEFYNYSDYKNLGEYLDAN